MQEDRLKDALEEAEIEIEEIAVQLADMLKAALSFAGVKEKNMPQAVDAYLQGIDETFEDEDGEMGFEEIIKVIKHMQKAHSELFA
jgi:hypothetical protein